MVYLLIRKFELAKTTNTLTGLLAHSERPARVPKPTEAPKTIIAGSWLASGCAIIV